MYCSKISKEVDTTYAHTVRIISRLEEEGLIQTRKKVRKKFIKLIEQGEKYAEKFQHLLDLFEGKGKNLENQLGSGGLERDIKQA
ncbi:MAG: hypothetical protein ABEJ87_01380 [Candidatus Nanohalobium sp.]